MSDKLSTFSNQNAEAAVLYSVLKHHQFFPAFEALSVDDFTQSMFGNVFAKMRELHAAGTAINVATVQMDINDEEHANKYGQDCSP